jgi:poly-gamma-glutamate synthesis protein (capsule biosynthesis protein)
MDVIITPALQANCRTTYVSDEKAQRDLYNRLEDISVNAQISDGGIVTQEKTE